MLVQPSAGIEGCLKTVPRPVSLRWQVEGALPDWKQRASGEHRRRVSNLART